MANNGDRAERPAGTHDGQGATVINFRTTRDLRAALEAEARRSHRSLSRVAHAWLEKGRLYEAFERRIVEEDERRVMATEMPGHEQ